ncbi:hypothetical protein [Dongia sp. agr-C8]
MTVVFLSGSRKISRIGCDVRERIKNMVENHLKIVVGDANGADKAMQSCLHEMDYSEVTVHFVGAAPRNNIGHWPTRNVITSDRLSGRHFYAQKDKEMSRIADCGLVLWDGKSSGSVQNMFWLLAEGKKLVVYFAPEKRFYNFQSKDQLIEFLLRCDDDTLDELERKISIPERLRSANRRQVALEF